MCVGIPTVIVQALYYIKYFQSSYNENVLYIRFTRNNSRELFANENYASIFWKQKITFKYYYHFLTELFVIFLVIITNVEETNRYF